MKLLTMMVALVAMLASSAQAQVYPARPITLIVPYSAGGPTDTLGRIMAEHMRGTLGQTVVVENVTGAGGTIGVGRVARAAADGYMVGIGQVSTNNFNGATQQLPYDLLRDLPPVALLTIAPMWIIGKGALPANNVKELIVWLKANPDKATMGAVGWGSASHLCGIYFQNHTGTRLTFVPYRGAAPANQDLVAGQIDVFCPEASNSLPLVKGGKVKAFAVLSQHRWPAAARRADHGRGRLAGPLHSILARLLRACRYAQGHRRQAQRGGGRGGERSRHPPAADRHGA